MINKVIKLNTTTAAKILLIATILSLIVSCNSVNGLPAKELSFPKDTHYSALIRTGEHITVLVDGGKFDDLKYYANEGSQGFTQFGFPDDPHCDPVFYYAYESLPDGRLQVWKSCLTESGNLTYLIAYDWQTHQLEQIAGPLPVGSSGASWNPDGTKAIGFLDSKFASKTLFWISKGEFSPLDLVVGDQYHAWNLSDDFPDFKADDLGKTGTTGRAAWSPNGKSIAFFASPDAIGKTSFARFGVEFNLYLMDPETMQYQIVMDKIYSPFVLEWSPDSREIAFIGKYGPLKENGIWLFSVNTKSIINIAKGIFQGLVWRPDGKNLVAIHCKDLEVCAQVVNYDLTNDENR